MVRSGLVKKGKWSPEEDELLRRSVELHGKKSWSKIAKVVVTRDGKQCRDRYCNHLDPNVVKAPWSEAEDAKLLEVHAAMGNKWADIAKLFPGRTDNAVRLLDKLHLQRPPSIHACGHNLCCCGLWA